MNPRKVHILSRESFGDLLLGPQIRLVRMAQEFINRGFETTIYGHPQDSGRLQGKNVKPIQPGFTRSLGTSDIIIASELLQARPCRELLETGLRFHWDCYGLSLPETLSFLGRWTWLRSLADRRRKLIRYRALGSRAESVWVSNSEQSTFIAALLATSPSIFEAKAANFFPKKSILAPMGVNDKPFPRGSTNPYPANIQERPIFLWGGGIWQWFDVETVLNAMSRIPESNSSPVLFFISGRNETTKDYSAALENALTVSRQLGLLDKSVFFNDQRVGPAQLAPWLEHCTAGIMGSPSSLESQLSWRTRYLDLLWAGKPLVACGPDPLANILKQEGAAVITAPGDSAGLAAAIESFSGRDSIYSKACLASQEASERFRWSRTLQVAVDRAVSTPMLHANYPNLTAVTQVRYLLGI